MLELLVVLVILGAVLTVAQPTISGAIPGIRLRAAASDLANDLRALRSAAVRTHRETWLELDPSRRQYRLPLDTRTRHLPGAIDITYVPPPGGLATRSGAAIRFFPNGGSSGGQFRLDDGTRRYELTVGWLTGRVSIGE